MDEWKKISVVGAGSYGKVYYALRIDPFLRTASAAAVKSAVFPNSISLHREAQILTTLRGCPNVVQFFGSKVNVENGIPTYNLFLEYASGGSLHDLINSKRGNPMSELEVGFYTYQLLKGIRDVHGKGWVHCDIKPANVLVFKDNNERGMHKLKLADFGLSFGIADGMAYGTGTPLSNRGTLLYAPPESLKWGIHGKAYDIWSLGCTVAEMMSGNRVWTYLDTQDLQLQIMNMGPEIPRNVSEIARDFLYKCFVSDPQKRWTAEQLLQHPFIRNAAELCTTCDQQMPQTQDRIIPARVNPFRCNLPVQVRREDDLTNLLSTMKLM